MPPSLAPVLVTGAGPSGLAAALTLLQNDIPVRVITKESEYRRGQRGSGVWPRTLEGLHFLRAFEVHQRGTPVLPIQEYKPCTLEPRRTFSVFPYNEPTPSTPYVNPLVLGQPTLEEILRSHIEKSGCFVELGTELLSFEDDGERVLAKLVKRKDGQETFETFEASYLVGADGAKGVTRKQLGLTFVGETIQDFACVVGDLYLELEGLDRHHWHFFGDTSGDFFSLRPAKEIAPHGFQFLMTMKNYTPKQLLADEKLMVKCMSQLTGQDINIKKADAMSEFRSNIRMVDKFGSGRVFVAGDAAHVHSPTGGQGLNSGVQDALNLAWKLSLVYKGLSPSTLLDSYTTERIPVIAEMLNITTGILTKLRSTPTMESAMQRDKRIHMLGVNCRSSTIVLDEFTQAKPVSAYGVLEELALVAGDRAPDAPELTLASSVAVAKETNGNGTQAETRLFDVFCLVYHTVLVFTPDVVSAADVLEVLKKYPGDVVRLVIVLPHGSNVTSGGQVDVVVDRGGHAYRAYLAVKGEKKVIVVRPDGVVGAMVHGVEGVGQYFSKIFASTTY